MIDVVHEVGSTQRAADAADESARTVTISRTYDCEPEELWDACTNAERIPRWFLPISGTLRVGGRYQLEGNAGGTIEECEPPHRFSATWEYGETVSRIVVRLLPQGDGRTRLELAHSGPADAHWDQFGPGAVGVGWDLTLLGLGQHLASGQAADRDEVEAWTASADGRRFMLLSSEAWGDAAIAGGTTPEEAREQARRTAEAYTGG